MEITDKEQQRMVLDWLEGKGINPDCSECGEKVFLPQTVVVFDAPADGGIDLSPGGDVTVVRVLQLICQNCYSIRQFAAKGIGL